MAEPIAEMTTITDRTMTEPETEVEVLVDIRERMTHRLIERATREGLTAIGGVTFTQEVEPIGVDFDEVGNPTRFRDYLVVTGVLQAFRPVS